VHNHEKEYVVAVDKAITPEFVASMSSGVRLSDATTKPCKVEKLGAKIFRITLTQGLNRQIRRMAEAHDYTVEALQRIRIMHIKLGQLPIGRWRNLSEQEVKALFPQQRPAPAQSNAPAHQNRPRPPQGGPPQRSQGGPPQRSRGGPPPRQGSGGPPRHGGGPSRHGSGGRPGGGGRSGGARRGRG
jgi:23S rRNA pseudouridine2604 synthase